MRYIILTDSVADCVAELEQFWPNAKIESEPVLDVTCEGPVSQLIFARQILPDPTEIVVESIAKTGEDVAGRIIESLAGFEGSWAFHIFATDPKGGSVRRVKLIEDSAMNVLKRRQKRLVKTLRKDWSEALVQCGFVSGEQGFYSCVLDRKKFPLNLSNYPGGFVPLRQDKGPPARAYLKLLEAELRFGRHIGKGHSVIDLGASPGSWSYVALQRGAQVLAVDRSALRDDLMDHRNLTFRQGDAFHFTPDRPADWLLCDVIADPRRTSQLLSKWLEKKWCKRFIVTLKFKGGKEWTVIKGARELVESRCSAQLITKLTENKNEITLCGEL